MMQINGFSRKEWQVPGQHLGPERNFRNFFGVTP